VTEALFRVNFNGQIVLLLAEGYTVTDDLKSITINIRKGVKFHDGTTFDGAAAKWNLDWMGAGKCLGLILMQ
jgi:ABC-type transport system substrate-binding protein